MKRSNSSIISEMINKAELTEGSPPGHRGLSERLDRWIAQDVRVYIHPASWQGTPAARFPLHPFRLMALPGPMSNHPPAVRHGPDQRHRGDILSPHGIGAPIPPHRSKEPSCPSEHPDHGACRPWTLHDGVAHRDDQGACLPLGILLSGQV